MAAVYDVRHIESPATPARTWATTREAAGA